jgi:hypothetical protein
MPRKRSLLLLLALVATSCLRSQAPELIVEYLDHAPPARGEPRAAKSLFLHVQMSMSSASQRRAIAGRLGLPFLRCLHPEAAGATFFASDPLGGIPGDPRIRALTASGIAVQVLTRGVSAEETLAAAMSETHPYAVLIGASAGASPKPGWRRVEHATLDREIWTRGVRLEPRSIEGAPLRFAVTKIPGKRSFEAITKTPVYPEHLQGSPEIPMETSIGLGPTGSSSRTPRGGFSSANLPRLIRVISAGTKARSSSPSISESSMTSKRGMIPGPTSMMRRPSSY